MGFRLAPMQRFYIQFHVAGSNPAPRSQKDLTVTALLLDGDFYLSETRQHLSVS